MRSNSLVAVLGFACVSIVTAAASASEVQINGGITYKVEAVGQAQLGADRQLVTQRLTGAIAAADKKPPLDGSLQECLGAFVIEKGQAAEGHGYCVTRDADNDVWWLAYAAGQSQSQSTWMVTGGTGKYAGMTGNGTTTYSSDPTAISAAAGWTQSYSGTLNFR